MSQAVKCRFFKCQKRDGSWHGGYWEFLVINSHKGVKKYSPGGFLFFFENFVRCPNYGRFSEFWCRGSADKASFYGMKGRR